ncbi:MAG: ATP-binding protein [Chloroflexota bacterium]|nr:ATP-binding protein [Chloroflexota bacterium]
MRLGGVAPLAYSPRGAAIDTLQWAVGAFCGLVGALMIVAPHHFGPAYTSLRPHPTLWAAVVLLAGAALIGVAALAPRRSLVILAHLVAGGVLLAFGVATSGGWMRTLGYVALALGTAAAPILSGATAWRAGSPDLFTVLMGATAVLTGLIILAAPDLLGALGYSPAPSWYGVASLVSGLTLVFSQMHRSPPRALSRCAHLLAAGTLFSYLFAVPLAPRAWGVITYYGGFGTILGLLPWLSPRLRCVDPGSLRTRVALALAIAAALPLTVALALEADREERAARDEALAVQHTRAVALAQHVADAAAFQRAALAALAAQSSLSAMEPTAQGNLVRGFATAYPDITIFSTVNADGEQMAWSGQRPIGSVAGSTVFEVARLTNQAVLDVGSWPFADTLEVVFGEPIRQLDGGFAGLALGVVTADRLVALLDRAGPGYGGEAYLIDASGRAIGVPAGSPGQPLDDVSEAPPVAALLTSDDSSGALSYGAPTGERLAGYARVPGLGWAVVVERPAAAALATTRAAGDMYFGMLVSFIAAATALGAVTGSWLGAPLDTLSRAVGTFKSGDVTAPLPRSRITEVAHVARVFGELRDDLAARTAERARAEQHRNRLLREIDRERATLAGTMAGMSDGLIVIDSAGLIRYCNARAGTLLGADPRALTGAHAEVAFGMIRRSFGDPSTALAAAREAIATPEQRPSFEVAVVRPARRDVLFQIFPVADAGTGLGVGMLLHDVTAERDLQRTKDELVSVVSHELRTPLASVTGFAELLLMREWSEAERQHFLTVMVDEGRRLTALVNEFLSLQRIESGREPIAARPTDLRPVLERAVAGAGADPARPIILDVIGALPPVRADADRVQQVLSNLLSNARKFSPDGGPVRLEALATDGVVQVSVSDEGLGIPPETLPRLFEKFYRVDCDDHRAIQGTGLGLAIVQSIVQAHRGRIWAESPGPGQGARFSFTLPLADGDVLEQEGSRGSDSSRSAAGAVSGARAHRTDVCDFDG